MIEIKIDSGKRFCESILLKNRYYIFVGKMWDYGYLLIIKDYNIDFRIRDNTLYHKANIKLSTVNNHLKNFKVKAIDTDL